MHGLTPLLRMEQHPFDDLGLDVVRPQVFDGAHGIEGGLDNDAALDDGTAMAIAALIVLLHGRREVQIVHHEPR